MSDDAPLSALLAKTADGDNAPPLGVSELSARLKRHVEDGFGYVRVRGEISGWKRAASGHCYLTLKDDAAVIDGVMWKGSAASLPFAAEDGLDVVATGRLTTYPGRSKYQLVIDSLELAGEGALLALFEKLKAKLAAEGLFDTAKRRPLPFMPKIIGVVTSPTGAVIRDILHRLSDRMPTHVILWPVLVQGQGAAAQVSSAINGFSMMTEANRPDLVIVARGGGSIEDLWTFNEEIVVRAVANCSIPIISAVGHETDTTLCDHAADRRAPTPTAAAELAVPVRSDLLAAIQSLALRNQRCVRRVHERADERLSMLVRRLPKASSLLGPQTQRVDDLVDRKKRGLSLAIARSAAKLARSSGALRPATLQNRIGAAQSRLAQLWRVATSLNPDLVLKRGYARVERRGGGTIVSAQTARSAGALTLHFADGSVDVRVERAMPAAYGKPQQGSLL